MGTLNLIFREVDRNHFDRIVSGNKTIEVRAGSPEYNKIKAGDEITISCGKDKITKSIKEVLWFKNTPELLNNINKKEVWTENVTDEQAEDMLNSFPNYPDRIKEYGLLAWKL